VDGLDVSYHYPQYKENFSQFIHELSTAYKQHGLLLTAAVSAKNYKINILYDVPALANSLDWINLTAILEFDQPSENIEDYVLLLHGVKHAVKFRRFEGMPASKIVTGILNQHGIIAPSSEEGDPACSHKYIQTIQEIHNSLEIGGIMTWTCDFDELKNGYPGVTYSKVVGDDYNHENGKSCETCVICLCSCCSCCSLMHKLTCCAIQEQHTSDSGARDSAWSRYRACLLYPCMCCYLIAISLYRCICMK